MKGKIDATPIISITATIKAKININNSCLFSAYDKKLNNFFKKFTKV
jgi:hypothetical protein